MPEQLLFVPKGFEFLAGLNARLILTRKLRLWLVVGGDFNFPARRCCWLSCVFLHNSNLLQNPAVKKLAPVFLVRGCCRHAYAGELREDYAIQSAAVLDKRLGFF